MNDSKDSFAQQIRQIISSKAKPLPTAIREMLAHAEFFTERQVDRIHGLHQRWRQHESRRRKGLYLGREEQVAHSDIIDQLLDLLRHMGKEEADHDVKHILFLSANPGNTALLRLDLEFREVGEALKGASKRDSFRWKKASAVRIEDLYRLLLEERPQILHFAGHGVVSEDSGQDSRALTWAEKASPRLQGGIALLDSLDDKKIQWVKASDLAELFAALDAKLEAVFLNACYTQVQAQAMLPHVAHVIGTQTAISDKFAIAFARAFYEAVGAGQEIPDSVKLAQAFLKSKGFDGVENIACLSRS